MILRSAIKARREEIRLYDVNIFNFRHVAGQVGDAPEYQAFKADLQARAEREAHEKRKAEMVLQALIEQRKAVPWWWRWRA